MSEYKLFFKSCGAGLMTFGVVIILGGILDIFINVKTSNTIAVFSGLIFNYMLQERIFKSISIQQNYYIKIIKYIIVDLTILILNSVLFNIFIDLKPNKSLPDLIRKHYPTIVRIIVGIIIWVFISFPLRRYFIF